MRKSFVILVFFIFVNILKRKKCFSFLCSYFSKNGLYITLVLMKKIIFWRWNLFSYSCQLRCLCFKIPLFIWITPYEKGGGIQCFLCYVLIYVIYPFSTFKRNKNCCCFKTEKSDIFLVPTLFRDVFVNFSDHKSNSS